MGFDHLQSIYRNYDIRGSYPDEINETEVKKIGQALVELYDAKTIVIGHDYRPSAESLHQALINGILSQGSDVISVGRITTPMLYHAAGIYDCQASVMITASHMAAGFNGMKICVGNVVPLGLDFGLDKLCDRVKQGGFKATRTPGSLRQEDIVPSWQSNCQKLAPLTGTDVTKVVIDPANMVGILELETFRSFSQLKVEAIYDTYDHSCPNHEANPIKLETLEALGAKVVATGADLGVAFDGDADRMGIVDERGVPVPQDIIGILIALELLKQEDSSGIILCDIRSSKQVTEAITSAGGRVIPWRIGHTYLRRKMREVDAVYAFELSGHHFFKSTFYSDGGAVSALLLINLIRRNRKPLSQLVAKHQVYYHSGEINSEVDRKPEQIYQQLRETFKDAGFETIDGLTIRYQNWWFNVRPSANDPVMRLNLEADTKELQEEKVAAVLKIILNRNWKSY